MIRSVVVSARRAGGDVPLFCSIGNLFDELTVIEETEVEALHAVCRKVTYSHFPIGDREEIPIGFGVRRNENDRVWL